MIFSRDAESLHAAQDDVVAAIWQVIDVRDLAEWTVSLCEGSATGTYNATHPGVSFAELLETVKVASLGQIVDALFEVGGRYRRTM